MGKLLLSLGLAFAIALSRALELCAKGFRGFGSHRMGDNPVKVGTEQYNPPEVQEGEKYNPMMLDIFSCGVVLFTMMFGNYPFAKATKRDAA